MYLTKYYYEMTLPSGQHMLVNFLTGKWFYTNRRIINAIRSFQTTADVAARNFLLYNRFLFEEEAEEQKLIDKSIAQYHMDTSDSPNLYGLCLTYDCNLRCPYCYENGIGRQDTLMSEKEIDRALKGIAELNARLGKENSLLVLFGGEPFMESNRTAVEYFFKQAAEYCDNEERNGRSCRLVLFSNGFELAGFLPLLEAFRKYIDSVMLTLNGVKAVHDRFKISVNQESSFDRTTDVIERLLKAEIPVNVRCDVDKTNIRALPQAADAIIGRGWDKNPLFRYYISPIKWCEGSSCLSEGEILRSFLKLDAIHGGKLSRVFELGALRIVHNLMRMLKKESGGKIAYQYCESVRKQQYIFGTDGCIYKCLSSIGKKELAFGEYGETVTIYQEREDSWNARNVMNIPKCRNCRFALVCGGGCALKAEQCGNLYEPQCEDVRAVVDAGLFAIDKETEVKSYGFYYD